MLSVAESFAAVAMWLEHDRGTMAVDSTFHHCWSLPPCCSYMMVKTRQRAQLEVAQEAKSTPYSQERVVEENVQPTDDDKVTELSSEDSEGELPDKELPVRLEQSDNKPKRLSDVLALKSSDEAARVIAHREKVQVNIIC